VNKYLALSFFVVFLGAMLTVAQDAEVAATIAFTEGPTAEPVSGDHLFRRSSKQPDHEAGSK
jgi:hypothetical protein